MHASTASLLPPLCVAVPLMAAALLVPLSKLAPRWLSCAIATAITLAVIAMALLLAFYSAAHGPVVDWMGGWTPHDGVAIGISFTADPIGAGLAAFVGLLVLSSVVYTYVAFELTGTLFHALLLAFLAAMCGYALTGDLFNMFVWFELMTAAAIALVAHRIEAAEPIECAINLAVTNTIAGFLVLLGIALIYGRTDALNLAQLGVALAKQPADALVAVSFALIVAGYFVKGAVAPFHFWLDDAHAVAPTPVCILFSGIMVQLAIYAVARIYWTVYAGALGPHAHVVQSLFLGVGIVTALVGGIMAFAQRHLKRLLAFSTVSHSGMFVAAIGLLGTAGAAAVALFIVAHGLIKGALFACSGNYLNRFRSLDEELLGCKGHESIVNTALFLLGGLALAGMPPFAISAAKALYDAAMKDRGLMAVAGVMALASVLDAGAVVRAGLHVAWGIGQPQRTGRSPREEQPECSSERLERTPWTMQAIPIVLLALAGYVGTNHTIASAIERSAAAFTDRAAYTAAVLERAPQPPPAASAPPVTAADLELNFGVAAAAVVAALLGLFRGRIPALLAPVFGPPLQFLRRLHSGIFTDYVVYLVFGVAAYAAYLVTAIR